MTTPPAVRVLEHELLKYRRVWWGSIFSSFLSPVLFLAAMGVGLGSYVSRNGGTAGAATGAAAAALGGVIYLVFIAPGPLASTAMQAAAGESTFPIMGGILWDRTPFGMLATPIGVVDVAVGEIGWALIRGAIYATTFLLVMFVLGLVRSPLAILALPAAILIGFAFAGVGMAATSFMRTWQDMDMVQMVTLPLFLFSATFDPLDTYPGAVRLLVQLTPL